ncbi:hypothetical protein [Kribbella qitaiheensis]|uniref:hypothetical protein n=1 Tax=Kribbella qitaiheensis TaxID=1544730 RepID=UPI0019D67B84|nr:hypothetical protein [Kribbella qitaiheensis]
MKSTYSGAAADRARAAGFTIQTDVHHNPNADHHELWLRDPDHYLVVLADLAPSAS